MPQRGQVGGEFLQAGPVRQRREGGLGGLQGLLGVGERGEPGFPAGFQGAGDQPVLRLDLAEGPLGAVGLIAGALDGQLGCPACPLVLAGHLAGCGERERDLLGGEGLQQHGGDGVVDRVRGDAAAAGGFLAVAVGVAFVAGPVIAVVVGGHRPAAAAADDDPLAQRRALPHRPAAAPGVVGGQPRLDRQVLLPGDVAGVMILDHDRPLRAGHLGGHGAHVAVGVDRLAGHMPAVHVRAGVGRVLQHLQHPVVGQRGPAQLPGPHAAVGTLGELAAGERRHDAVSRPGRGEAGEDVSDGGLDLGIGVEHDRAVVVVDQPDRQRGTQLAALGGGPLGRLQPPGHDVQLRLAHRGFQAQDQPVVEIRQVVDPVAVDEQRTGQPGHLRQPGQVRVRAAQPGDLQPEHRPDLAQAHPRHQLPESLTVRRRRPGQAQVPVDHLHILACPAQRHRGVGQRVLPQRRLGVLADLHQGGLAQVDQRRPGPVPAGDLVLAVHPCLPARRTSCRPPPPPLRPGRDRPGRRRPSATAVPCGPAARR